MKYIIPIVLWFIISLASILFFYVAGYTAHHFGWVSDASLIAGIILLNFIHHWFFHKILSEAMVDVVITNKRIMFLHGSLFFQDDMHEVLLNNIRAVEARKRGILQNVLRYGSLWFDTGGTQESSRLVHQVPHPHAIVREITKLLEMR